jgi:hypothetical protein
MCSYLDVHQDNTMRQVKGQFPYDGSLINPASVGLPSEIDGKKVEARFVSHPDELRYILDQSNVNLNEVAKNKIIDTFFARENANPPISGARTFAPGQGFNRDLAKLEGIVEDLRKMNEKHIDPAATLEKHLQNPKEPSAAENAWAQGVVDRVNKKIAEDAATTSETIEDLLEDASELPINVTVHENGISMTNTKDGPMLTLRNGVKVGRF